MIKKITLSLLLFLFNVCLTYGQQPRKIKMSDTVSMQDKIYSLSTLWKEASYNFVWFDKQPNLKWDSVYTAYLPKVIKASNVFEVNRVLTKFLEELKDGHTAVWANQGFWDEIDQPPLTLSRFEGKIVISKVDSTLKDQIPIQSEVLTINDRNATEFLKNDYWLGFKGTTVKLSYLKPDGSKDSATLKRNLNDLFKQGNFKYYPSTSTPAYYKFKHTQLNNNIALVSINTFADSAVVDSFKRILPILQKNKAIILDLRNNGGGNSDYALAIAKIITDKNYLVGPSWQTRINNAANKAWGSFNKISAKTPNYQFQEFVEQNAWEKHPGDTVMIDSKTMKLSKPVVILTSKSTYSAAEDFLIYLLGSKNITRIGQASAGSSGQPITIDLPIGMKARICAKRDALPDGTDYIGKGIAPTIEVPVKPLFSTDKEDRELQAALTYLTKIK